MSDVVHQRKHQQSEPEFASPPPKNWADGPKAPNGVSGLEALTYPRGGLGYAVQYIVDTAALPDRVMALSGALSALAKGIDRKVMGPTGSGTVLFNLLVAHTGSGKQHVLDCIRFMLRAMEIERCIAGSGLSSVQAVEEILEGPDSHRGDDDDDEYKGNISPLVLVDEAGGWLARIGGKSQGGNVSEIPSALQTLWGWHYGVPWNGSMRRGKKIRDIYDPAFAIWGNSTERKLFEALKLKDVSTGFVNRFLALKAGNDGRGAVEMIEPKYSFEDMPDWLADGLKKCAGKAWLKNAPRRQLGTDGTVHRDYRGISWSREVKERWYDYGNSIRGMTNEEDREYWIRAPEIALRLATIEAAYLYVDGLNRLDGEIDLRGLEWSIAVAEHSTKMLKAGLDRFGIEDLTKEDLADRLKEEFHRRKMMSGEGVMTLGECHQVCFGWGQSRTASTRTTQKR